MRENLKKIANKLQRRSLSAGRIHKDMSLQELWTVGLTEQARDRIIAQLPHFTVSGDAVVVGLGLSAIEYLAYVKSAQKSIDDEYSGMTMLSRKLHHVSLNEVEWFLLAIRYALEQDVTPERLDKALRENESFDPSMPVVAI